jgi:hypothetical protein
MKPYNHTALLLVVAAWAAGWVSGLNAHLLAQNRAPPLSFPC